MATLWVAWWSARVPLGAPSAQQSSSHVPRMCSEGTCLCASTGHLTNLVEMSWFYALRPCVSTPHCAQNTNVVKLFAKINLDLEAPFPQQLACYSSGFWVNPKAWNVLSRMRRSFSDLLDEAVAWFVPGARHCIEGRSGAGSAGTWRRLYRMRTVS
ncbi:hypothetical protein PAXRUDRAFT_606770 [Paxillus rubicundulus Ve08.2h10]|uniref:Unplaced genomic scaffold scaffold_511, whole genome shotgun sequence n=1 Tax=Paxillus rubicundulus Ve08.2h10 TaxID=930991 RepID=A0A0D0E433_9AGAM|nr:hypothetical protein PAXRUDRAFT_606770 [Paxillus rubicundulus Ve08.2h10]